MAFKKKMLNYWAENEDSSVKVDTPAEGEKDGGRKDDAGNPEINVAETSKAVEGRSSTSELKPELSSENDQKPRTKLMNINTCIEVIVMNELKKLDSVSEDMPSSRQMPLFATLDASKNRPPESRGTDNNPAWVNAGGNRSTFEPGWLSRNESVSRAPESESKREKWPQYVNADASPGRTAAEFSALSGKSDVGGGMPRNVPSSSGYRVGVFPPEANLPQDLPRIYMSSTADGVHRNTRLLNQFGESGMEVPASHAGPVVKYSPSSAWARDISPAQSSPHVMMSSGDSGYKVNPSGQVPAAMLDNNSRRKPEREPEHPTKYQQAEYLSYISQQQQYHGVPTLPDQHPAYQNCTPVLQEKHHVPDAIPVQYGYPPVAKSTRERVHAGGQFDPSFGNHPENNLQPPIANYVKHSPKSSPLVTYERDGSRPVGLDPQYHRSDQPQYHRSDQPQYHRSGQPQYHQSDLLKSQPGSLMAGTARTYRMVVDQQQPQAPPPPQVIYRNERQARAEPSMDKKGFPYQGPTPEEYVERRMKRTSTGNSREMGNSSVGPPDQHIPPRSFSMSSYPPSSRGHREVAEKAPHPSGQSEERPLDLTVKKEFSDAHHPSMYLLQSGLKQQHQNPDWGVQRGVMYRTLYGGEEDPLGARLMNRPAPQQKPPDFAAPEIQRRDILDVRSMYEKVPSGSQVMPTDSEVGRMVPTPVNERNLALRTSVIASHPFDDSPGGHAPQLHLTMQHLSEALTKNSMGTWKQSPYAEMVPRSRAHTLDSAESSSRLTIVASQSERQRPRPSNNSSGTELLHLATTSPTIPHLSPVQPLVSTAGSQAPGSRRAPGPSLLGSHSPSDILHLQCKVCGSTYGSLRSFRMHFAKVHGLEPLPEHCNISTISGTKSAMSKVPMEDSEPPSLQRETMPTDVVGKNRGGFDSFGSPPARPAKPDILRVEPALANTRTKQVAEVYPMPARASRGLSPQLKNDAPVPSAWQSELTELRAEQNDAQTKLSGDVKSSARLVNCDLGIFRSRNCYSDLGCDRDTDCPECLDGFKDISDWKMHISTHMMRSCTCKACNLSFTHSGALKKHLHAVHSHVEKVEVEYRCLFCREAFSDEKVLFYHTQEHEKRYSRLDSSRRDSISSSLSLKAPGGMAVDSSEGIQMAVPDTTCSDDARPTSGGENSSNVSPSSFPGAESKGSDGYDSKTTNDSSSGKADGESVKRKMEDFSTDDDKKPKIGESELGYKHRTALRGSDSSSGGSGQTRFDSAPAAASQLSHTSHGSRHGLKVDDREMSTKEKPNAKFSFQIGEECRHFKPATTPKPAEETSTFVWKKQAVLKRVQGAERRNSDPDAPADKPNPISSGAGTGGRLNGGGAGAEKSSSGEASQPMHLRDLFSMMGHQVETSIWGIPDFPQFNPVPAARGSRCVRDVCDEIIALSFREESSPKESSAPGSSLLEKLDVGAKTRVSEQLKSLVDPETRTEPPPDVRTTNNEGLYGGWTRSPCSSRDSCHSLEIDESGFNRDSVERDSVRLESTDSEPRSVCGEPVVGSTSPRPERGRKESTETAEDGKYPVDSKSSFGGRSQRSRGDDESGVRHLETFYGRRLSSEGPPVSDTVGTRTKDVVASPLKQENSLEGDEGNSYPTPTTQHPIPSESVATVGSKRKHSSGGSSKETGDTGGGEEPPAKKSVTS